MMDIREAITLKLPFLNEEGLKDEIAQRGKLVELASGVSILNEGSYVKTVPILLDGLVKVIKRESAGKEILLYYIYPLESCIVSINCGLNELKSGVQAVTEDASTALLIPSTVVGDWQRKYVSFNKYVLNLYQKRFDNMLGAYNALAFQSMDERLMSHLIAKSQALGVNKVVATHQELGDEMGTARETISRILKKMEVEGKVNLNRGWIEILV